MKKIFTLLTSFFMLSNICYSQSGWFWQNPLPQGNELYSVKLIDANTAYACGYSGVIIKTTNRGINWNTLKIDSGFISTSLFFHNAITGWITSCEDLYAQLGHTSKVLKTTDGGMNWAVKFTTNGSWYYSIEFTGLDTGYMLAKGSQWGLIYKTTNRGENWDYIYSCNGYNVYSSYFLNSLTGYVCGSIGIIKTTNGGINWFTQLDGTYYPYTILSSIVFPNTTTGYSVGYRWSYPTTTQAIYKTTNAGTNWIIQNGLGTAPLVSVCFIYPSTGFAVNQSMITTTNGGINWTQVYLPESLYGNSIDIKSAIGMAVGYRGIILTTTNSGANWINDFPSIRGSGYGINCIRFCNKYTGFAATGTNVLKTTNGGNNWLILTTPSPRTINDLAVIDCNIIYAAVGESSAGVPVVMKSVNGGLNWILQNSQLTDGVVSISFVNASTGFSMCWQGVSKTTNGGDNWINIPAPISGSVKSIYFVNADIGYIIGFTSSSKTTDGGAVWTQIPVNGESIFFLNESTGYAAGRNMRIQKTTNGGANWVTQAQSGEGWRFYAIRFLNSQTGFAAGDFGSIAKTTNGGSNWYYQMSPTNHRFASVYMTDTNECFIAGVNNTILKTTNGGIPIGIRANYLEVPSSFSLSQNYPNPFNPVTKIKYQVPLSRGVSGGRGVLVRLIIYDVLGRETETLVSESQKPGSYEVTWNGSCYASGVYFYKLMTDEWTETKKMVLIK